MNAIISSHVSNFNGAVPEINYIDIDPVPAQGLLLLLMVRPMKIIFFAYCPINFYFYN